MSAFPLLNFPVLNPTQDFLNAALGTYQGMNQGRAQNLQSAKMAAEQPHWEKAYLADIAYKNAMYQQQMNQSKMLDFQLQNPAMMWGGPGKALGGLEALPGGNGGGTPGIEGGAPPMPSWIPPQSNNMGGAQQMPASFNRGQQGAMGMGSQPGNPFGLPNARELNMGGDRNVGQMYGQNPLDAKLMSAIQQNGAMPNYEQIGQFGQPQMMQTSMGLSAPELNAQREFIVAPTPEQGKMTKQKEFEAINMNNLVNGAQTRAGTAAEGIELLRNFSDSYDAAKNTSGWNVGITSDIPYLGGGVDPDKEAADRYAGQLAKLSAAIRAEGGNPGSELIKNEKEDKVGTNMTPGSKEKLTKSTEAMLTRMTEEPLIYQTLSQAYGGKFDPQTAKTLFNEYQKERPASRPVKIKVMEGDKEKVIKLDNVNVNTWPEYLVQKGYNVPGFSERLSPDELKAIRNGYRNINGKWVKPVND